MQSVIRRTLRLLVLVALAVLVFMLFEYIEVHGDQRQLQADYRAPVVNPPVEPDRPDLFEEPRIEEAQF
jgi:hypothetical protein